MTTDSDKFVFPDTSIWIEYLHKQESVYSRLEKLMEQGLICTSRFVVAELLQGVRSDQEFEILEGTTEIFRLLEEKENTWREAARLSNQLMRKGTRVGLGDCYIATLAHQHNVVLWTADKHFRFIQKILDIRLLP